jgi:hypothetical protein
MSLEYINEMKGQFYISRKDTEVPVPALCFIIKGIMRSTRARPLVSGKVNDGKLILSPVMCYLASRCEDRSSIGRRKGRSKHLFERSPVDSVSFSALPSNSS